MYNNMHLNIETKLGKPGFSSRTFWPIMVNTTKKHWKQKPPRLANEVWLKKFAKLEMETVGDRIQAIFEKVSPPWIENGRIQV